jgi:uncharacterized protein YacL
MVLTILRALFVLFMAAAGWFSIGHRLGPGGEGAWVSLPIAITSAVLIICVDILAPRRKLSIFAGTFFGLIVGIAFAFGMSLVVRLVFDQLVGVVSLPWMSDQDAIIHFTDLILGMISCYLAISFILQTKDDFRFIIPYVEFTKETKGARPMLLDTSVLIDGRINDIVTTGIIESEMIVPRFVLEELQAVADSSDKLKRNRGRRGLDALTKLRGSRASVILYEPTRPMDAKGNVDQMLMELAKDLRARVLTNDYNLNKVAQLSGVDVININDLSNALKPIVLPGEVMTVTIVKPGEEPGQGIGYLSDGTMVVVEHARQYERQDVEIVVTRALQTSAGKMIFGRLSSPPGPEAPRRAQPAGNPQGAPL